MRSTNARRLTAFGALMLLLAVLTGVPGATAQPAAPANDEAWVSLGPTGPHLAAQVAVSSGWPADPFLHVGISPAPTPWPDGTSLVPRATRTARSYDGGETWEVLETAPPAELVVVLHTRDYGRVLLATHGVSSGSSLARTLRSTDDGATWLPASFLGARDVEFTVSPAVFNDGLVFALTNGELWESRDAGHSWTQRVFAPDLRVNGIWLSPTFSRDQTVFVSIGPEAPRGGWDNPSAINRAYDESHRWSILMSDDGGRTFADHSDGLEIRGMPTRAMNSLAFSPNFTADGSLFAYASGAVMAMDERVGVQRTFYHGGIFKSTDRGMSWRLVNTASTLEQTAAASIWGSAPLLGTAVLAAPDFAESGLVVAVRGSTHRNPALWGCSVSRSLDWGESWEHRSHTHSACTRFQFATGTSPRLLWVSYSGSSGFFWSVSRDGGFSIRGLGDSPQVLRALTSWSPAYGGAYRVAVAPDGTIFRGEVNGVWAQGASVKETFSRLPCSLVESPSIALTVREAMKSRAYLGCPTSPATVTEVRERRLGESRDIWVEGVGEHWYALTTREPPNPRRLHTVTTLNKTRDPWTSVPDRVVRGEIQHYEGGFVLRLPGNAVIVTTAGWEEVPEPTAVNESPAT